MSDLSMQGSTNTPSPAENAWESPWLLTQAREAAGLHIAALAAALKVPVRKLEALEAGRYDELPDLTFARGLASSACRHLRVDPAPVLEQIPPAVTPQLGGSALAINAPFKPVAVSGPANPVGWLSRPAVLVAIALMLGALVLMFLPQMVAQEPSAAVPSTSTTVLSAPVPEPVNTPAPAETVAPDGIPSAEAGAPVPTVALADVPQPPTAVGGGLLRIRATGDSWVQVADGTGTVLLQRVLKAGDEVDFSTAPPYAVVLGRVEAAEVTVRGQRFDATPFARNSVARFEVK